MKKILVIKSHPKNNSFCNALTDKYVEGAKKSGNHVKVLNLINLNLEKFLKCEYSEKIELTEDLLEAQELISWSNHLVFSFPIWWATPPALLKVFLEVIFESGFAFQYQSSKSKIPKIDKLLKDKSSRIISTMDAPTWYYKWLLGDPNFKMMKANLNFCGIKPVQKSYFGSVKMSDDQKKEQWLEQIYKVGERE